MTADATHSRQGGPGGGTEPSVLLAHPDAGVRGTLTRLLGMGHRVIPVSDGRSALQAALAAPPDLVIAHSGLSGLDGLGFLRALRAAPGLGAIPVLMLAPGGDEDLRARLIEAGADDCVGEPAEPRDLVALVRAHLTLSRRRDEAGRHAEAVLRQSEERFARFMQYLPGLAWIKDLDGRYIFANAAAARAFGLPLSELYGKTDDAIFPPETAAQFRAHDARALAGGAAINLVETLEQADGVHHSLVSKFVIPDVTGRPQFVAGIAIDITERVRAEEALKDADRRKDRFLATVAHELRNPLAPIRSALAVLQLARETAGPEVERAQAIIHRQVEHMVRMVDELLEFSRIGQDVIELRPERLDLADVIRNAIETCEPMIRSAGHHLTLALPPEPLLLDADPLRLTQVFANLVQNAAKYTGAGGRIWLTARRDDPDALVSVRDNGIGISPQELLYVFDPFMQVSGTETRGREGLGIGLSLAARLVALHGGRIEARSAGPGAGSEFVVRLPLAAHAADSPGAPPGAASSAGRLPRLRVLVVDDNRDAADSLGAMLSLRGLDVRVVHDGPTAIESLGAFRPVLILLDLGMPGMDGYEVARRIRERPDGREVTLVALTGWGQAPDRRRVAEAGFDHHLVKPARLDELERLLLTLAH